LAACSRDRVPITLVFANVNGSLILLSTLANLKDIEDKPNYKFVKMNICDFDAFYQLIQEEHVIPSGCVISSAPYTSSVEM